MAKTWRVPVYWQMHALMEVEADSLDEAIEILQTGDDPLPSDGEYLDGTWEAGGDDTEEIRDLYNNGQEDEIDE